MKNVLELKDNEVIHCPTKEKAQLLMQLFHSLGLRWSSGVEYIHKDRWGECYDLMCYCPSRGSFSSLSFFESNNFIIHSVDDFIGDSNESTEKNFAIIGNKAADFSKTNYNDGITRTFKDGLEIGFEHGYRQALKDLGYEQE